MSLRPVPRILTIASSATGASTGVAFFGTGMRIVSAVHTLSGSTKAYVFSLEGSIGVTDVWGQLTAETTGSTAGGIVSSTVEMVFDKVRVNLSANDTTGDGTMKFTVLARP